MEILPTTPPSVARHKIEMVFRLWSPAKSFGSPESDGFTRYPEILAMIEDVAAAQRATLVAAGEQLSVTGLKRASDALMVSRQIQLALQGFRCRSVAEPVGLSIAINSCPPVGSPSLLEDGATDLSASEDHEPQPSHDLLSLLKISKPAQVLVTHDLSEQIGIYKGLPLRLFPGRFGVSEYLWTSTGKLDLLQSEPQLTLTTVPDLPKKPVSAPEAPFAVSDLAAPAEESAPFPMLRSAEKPEPNRRTSFSDPRKAAAIAAAILVFSAGLWGMYSAFRSVLKVHAPASHESSPEQPHAPSPAPLTTGPRQSARTPVATPSKTNTASATAVSKVQVRLRAQYPRSLRCQKHTSAVAS